MANASECFDRALSTYYDDVWNLNDIYQNTTLDYDNITYAIFNTTLFIQNTSNVAWICLDSIENLHEYIQYKIEAFAGVTGFVTAFF